MQDNCPKCGKKVASKELAGDLAAHMLQGYYCDCAQGAIKRPQQRQAPAARKMFDGLKLFASSQVRAGAGKKLPIEIESSTDFCPRCGLRSAKQSLPGSLTGYLFQDVRCKCLREEDFDTGSMSRKFWGLKKTGLGTTFSAQVNEGAPSSLASIDLAEGAVISQTYRIIRLIGRGGMGDVYLAEHVSLGKQCAIKVIPPDNVTEIGWRRFQQEAKAVSKLDQVNLVKVTDLGIHEGCLPYYAMEFVEGSTLAEMIASKGPMPIGIALEVFMQVCDGVNYAHRAGIVHRDLKPANIMVISKDGGKFLVKVLDFGLAKLTSQNQEKQSMTAVGDIFGSPFYMSPEQCAGEKIDHRSDIYSVGCTMFECLAGRPPFTGHLASAIVFSHQEADPPSLESAAGAKIGPESMEVVMAKLLRKNPVERYQSFLELRKDLEKVARGESVLPYYLSRRERTIGDQSGAAIAQKPSFKLNAPLALAALVLAAGALVASIYFSRITWIRSSLPTQSLSATNSASFSISSQDIEPSSSVDEVATTMETLTGEAEPGLHKSSVAPKSLSDSTPFSTVITDGGRSYRVFKFPSDIFLGIIGVPGLNWVQAAGSFKFAESEPIIFEPSPNLAKYPGYIKRFRPGDISDIEILLTQSDPNEIIHALANLPGISSLRSWAIVQSHKLDQESLKIIALSSKLERLQCSRNAADAYTLSKFPRLDNLAMLILEDYPSVDLILNKLKNSQKLRTLILKHSSTNDVGLAAIASLPNLEFLDVASSLHKVSELAILSRASRLSYLQVSSSFPLDAEAIKTLRSFKKLTCLEVASRSHNATARYRLREALPQVRFIDGRDGCPVPMLAKYNIP